jgi:hypothetical protein
LGQVAKIFTGDVQPLQQPHPPITFGGASDGASSHRFPPVIFQHAVWLYLRFTLS